MTTGKLFLLILWFVMAALFVAGVAEVEAAHRRRLDAEFPVRWIALPEHNIELGLKPDGTVIWKQALTSDVNVPYRTGP